MPWYLLLHTALKTLCWAMDWQQVVTLLIVVLTAGLFILARFRRRRSKTGCGSACGCAGAASETPKISVTYKARKGERPQIITRMS